MGKIDDISLQRIQTLHPAERTSVEAMYREACSKLSGNAMLRLAYTLRTFSEQDGLYAQGRTVLFDKAGNRLGIVTNAKGGQSYHNYGLAIDIVLLVDKDNNGTYEAASWDSAKDFDNDKVADWMEVVAIFKKYGWAWGGDWKGKLVDKPHFEKTHGLTVKECLARHNKKDFVPGTTYIRL